jgi:hypothetical protein
LALVLVSFVLASFGLVSLGLARPASAARGDLLGEWHLDDLSGADTSGRGHALSATGVGVVPGHAGGAYAFTGTQSVVVPRTPDLEPAALTVEAWVRHAGNPGSYAYVLAKGRDGCTAASWALYTGGGAMSFYVYDGSSAALSPDGGETIWDGAWHHLAGTYDGATVRLYVDGVEAGTGAPAARTIAYGLGDSNDLVIGNYPVSQCGASFAGDIDEVKVWDGALAAADIARLRDGQRPTGQATGPTNFGTGPAGPAIRRASVAADPHHRRSGLARALNGPDEVPVALKDLARSVLATAALMGLVLFPSQLFNSTLEENYDEVTGWFRRLAGHTRRVLPAGLWDSWAGFGVFAAVTALLYGLLSPTFGVNLGTLDTLAGVGVSTIFVTLLFAVPVRRHMAARYGDRGHIHVLPGTAGIAVACVVISRVAGFQPGYLYGMLAGFAFATVPSDDERGRVTARSCGWILGAAVAAWLLRTPLDSLADRGTLGPLGLVADAVLAAVFVAGVESMVFALVPLRFLAGETLLRWNRRRWLLLFGAGTFLFVHVLLNPRSGYLATSDATPLASILALFAVFGGASVAFWAYFRYRPAPAAG